VTATEADPNRRKGFMPWWRRRSWNTDLDTLTRLHKGLLALDVDPDAQHKPAPAPALPTPSAGLPAPQELLRAPQVVKTEQQTLPELAPGPDLVPDPAAATPHQTGRPSAAMRREAALHEEVSGGQMLTGQTLATEAESAQTLPFEAEQGEQGPDQKDAVPGPAAAEPDPAIAAIRETFRYVAEAGDKAVGFFYGQMFVRQPQLRQLFPSAMDEQRDRLFCALGRIVESLSAPEDMAAYLTQLGRDHRKYQVEPEMYEVVGASLLATLRAFARDAFTTEAEAAWTQVYLAGSSLMIKAAEEDSAASPASWTAEVVTVDHRADGIAVLTIAPDQPLPFTAGQHITVQTPRWPRVWRPYSIACMPRDDGLLMLHVKAVPGGWVSGALVRHTSPGSHLMLGPPLGTMTLERAGNRDLLCVAGGTGLSPVKAIIEQAVRESATVRRRIYLYYGARRRSELYDLPDLWRLEDAYDGFELIPVTSDDPAFNGMQGNVGRVAARYMPHTYCDAYVAGPPEMVRETIRLLARAGLKKERIHFDDALLAGKRRTDA
jgi:NAD(P)H-flavin reductase/hemoglobin-like flavoprotein